MNETIKNNIEAILHGYPEYNDDASWGILAQKLLEEEGNVKDIDDKARNAYQYLIEQADKISFIEFEEAFFFLMITAYEHERNLENPIQNLLSDDLLKDAAEKFGKDKASYLSQIYDLMQKQFERFLQYKNSTSETKVGLLPQFTFTLDSCGYWRKIKPFIEKALEYYPDGEIANRLACISDFAIQYGESNLKDLYNRKQEIDYAHLQKYLDSPRKDFLSDCFTDDNKDFYFPVIQPNYSSNDHEKLNDELIKDLSELKKLDDKLIKTLSEMKTVDDKLTERLNEELTKNRDNYKSKVNSEIRNKYMLRVLQHIFAKPAIISFFGKHANTVQSELGLYRVNQEKISLLNRFSHKYKNSSATTLESVGECLLSIDDDDTRDCGRLVMMEYTLKKDMAMEVEILDLEFNEKLDKLLENIRNTSYMGELTISDILEKSLKRCFLSLFYDKSDSGKKLRNAFFEKTIDDDELLDFQLSFENEVLIPNQLGNLFSWIEQNHFLQLKIDTISPFWEQLHFSESGHATIILTGWISEFFRNIFKYADKGYPVWLNFSENENLITLKIQNQIDTTVKSGTQLGLKDISMLAEKINTAVKFSGQSLIVNPDVFSVELRLSKEIFKKEGDHHAG